MLEVWRDGDEYRVRVVESCDAPAEAVYDLLADLRSHLEWGGNRLARSAQRLLSLDAPPGPAKKGTKFSSVGHTSGRAWHDTSLVTEAIRPYTFEFRTHGQLEDRPDDHPVAGDWIHRYDMAADGRGCILTYRMVARLTMPWYSPPGHHARYPAVVYNVFLPIVVERGIRSLLAMAVERAEEQENTASTSAGTSLAGGR